MFGLTFLGDAVVAVVSLAVGVYFHDKLLSWFMSVETLLAKAKAQVASLEAKASAVKAAVK